MVLLNVNKVDRRLKEMLRRRTEERRRGAARQVGQVAVLAFLSHLVLTQIRKENTRDWRPAGRRRK